MSPPANSPQHGEVDSLLTTLLQVGNASRGSGLTGPCWDCRSLEGAQRPHCFTSALRPPPPVLTRSRPAVRLSSENLFLEVLRSLVPLPLSQRS